MDSISNRVDRPGYSRVEELRNAFETTTIPSSPIKDDPSKSKSPISTGLTEQRRRMFEEQEQINKGWTSTNRRPVRKNKRILDFFKIILQSTRLGSIIAYLS